MSGCTSSSNHSKADTGTITGSVVANKYQAPTTMKGTGRRLSVVPVWSIFQAIHAPRKYPKPLTNVLNDAQIARRGFSKASRTISSTVSSAAEVGLVAVWVGPVSADERSVPAQDRLGGDEERRPAFSWHESRQGGMSALSDQENRGRRHGGPGPPVGGGPRGSRRPWRPRSPDPAERTRRYSEQAVEEAEGHGRSGWSPDCG